MKLLSTLFVLTLSLSLFSGCSKEVRINRKLEGSWLLESINGEKLPGSSYITYRRFDFTKTDKKSGNVYIETKSWNANDYSFSGTYELSDKTKLNMTLADDHANELTINYTVKSFSNDKIVLIDAEGNENLLKPE